MVDIFLGYDFKEWSEIIRNLALIAAAIFSGWVAWSGVSAWKKQKLWEADRDLSQRILTALAQMEHDYTELVLHARPIHTKHLLNEKYGDWTELESAEAKHHEEFIRATSDSLDKSRIKNEALISEASIFWGNSFSEVGSKLVSETMSASFWAESHISLLRKSVRDEDEKDECFDHLTKLSCLGERYIENDDDDFFRSLKKFRKLIKPYLGRSS